MLKFATMASAAVLLAACASTPDTLHSFYPARSSTAIQVNEAISCAPDKSHVMVAFSPAASMTTTYAADRDRAPFPLRIQGLDGQLSDTTIGIKTFDDGRLQSINTTSTGQGEAIVKAVIGAVGLVGGGTTHDAVAGAPPQGACAYVTANGKDGAIALTFNKTLRFEKHASKTDVVVIPLDDGVSNPTYYNALNTLGAPLQVFLKLYPETAITPVAMATPAAGDAPCTTAVSGTTGDAVLLTMQGTAEVQADLWAAGSLLSSGNYTIPSTCNYQLPIPKAAAFGGNKFNLTVNDVGAITAIEYDKTNGAVEALGTATAVKQAVTTTPAPPSH